MEPRSINRWQHRLKREHPTCTERLKPLIEECGWKGGDSGDSAGNKQPDQQIPKRIPLTPTGLLMEGDYTHNPTSGVVQILEAKPFVRPSRLPGQVSALRWRHPALQRCRHS